MHGKSEFEKFIADEISANKGVYFPVKAGVLERMLTKKAKCIQLHPNPEDEFCMPGVGPSFSIISEYQKKYQSDLKRSEFFSNEPVIVEKTHPDGYMIINGHHRWAAALRLKIDKLPVKVVNLMHEADVKKILANSKHDRRAVLDLDEVVFGAEEPLEKPLGFPMDRIYKERIRLGVPALFHFLEKRGYDIWLYSAGYYSFDYISRYFKKYHAHISGVISAIGKRAKTANGSGSSMEKQIMAKYRFTLHIDKASVLRVSSATKEFDEEEFSCTPAEWSQKVMEAVKALEKREEGADA